MSMTAFRVYLFYF